MSVKLARILRMRKDPRMVSPPTARGSDAATRLPKMNMSKIARMGNVRVSAFARSFCTCSVISWLMAATPPRRTCKRSLVSRGRNASRFFSWVCCSPVMPTMA